MIALQAARHTIGLILAAVGAFGLLFTIGMGYVVIEDANLGRELRVGRLIGCSTLGILMSLFLVWRGLSMRRRAIAAGSTIHIDADRLVNRSDWTTRSGTAKPSFLTNKPDGETGK